MKTIKAKSVVADKFWILHQDDEKVGEVIQIPTGKYRVSLKDRTPIEMSFDALKSSPMFTFLDTPSYDNLPVDNVSGFPVNGDAHNSMWDVKDHLPLYTTTTDSKSFFCAGYYKINIQGEWKVQFCPKLISLQRYEYKGPFATSPNLNQFHNLFK